MCCGGAEIALNSQAVQLELLWSLMWHLIEDFFEQSLVMKGFIGLGWLCILIMIASILLV